MSDAVSPSRDQIIEALRTVMDPELGRDIVSLDMVKNVAVCDGQVRLRIELTTPACPMKDQIRKDAEAVVSQVQGVRQVEVEFTAQVRPGPLSPVNLPGVKNVVAVGAGKGGVGKSTMAVLAAVGLAREGAKVGLLDADVYGPSVPKMLGIEQEKPLLAGERIVPVSTGGLKVMSMGLVLQPDQAVIWRGPMIHGAIRQFLEQVEWGELDYLIVDLPPGTGDVPLTLSQSIPMTGAVVVCTPQEVALLDAVRAARMYQQLNVQILGIVENMSYFIAPDTGNEYDLFGKGGAAKAAERLGVPFLGSIPINVAIRVSGDTGTPEAIFKESPQGVGEAVMVVVRSLAGAVSTRNREGEGPATLHVHS